MFELLGDPHLHDGVDREAFAQLDSQLEDKLPSPLRLFEEEPVSNEFRPLMMVSQDDFRLGNNHHHRESEDLTMNSPIADNF